MTLLEQITSFENLLLAFQQCSKRKRQSIGYQKLIFAHGEKLLNIGQLLSEGKYKWGEYREFLVRDPKARVVAAAPFRDRVVHTAIHRIVDPLLDNKLPNSVYACRVGKGNRHAVIDLLDTLAKFGKQRFVIKLDVKSFFASINHEILMAKVLPVLPDRSIDDLLWSLLKNFPAYAARGYGIPIGNLSSQSFANFYLADADAAVEEALGEDSFYFRYMDDGIFGGRDKRTVWRIASRYIDVVENELKLKIPYYKRMPLGNAPVPFLGFLLNHDGYLILGRNKRRFKKKMTRIIKAKMRPSYIAQVEQSFCAWRDLDWRPNKETLCFR